MSNSAPIIPPGSPLQRTRSERDSRLFVTVFAVLAIHVMLLAGLLIQGCKREDHGANAGQDNSLSNLPESASVPPAARAPAEPPAATPPASVSPTPTAPSTTPDTAAVEPAPALPATTDSIARTKVAPAKSAPAGLQPAAAPTVAADAFEGETSVYSVKPGDNLTKIARAHGTTVRAMRAANGLKTDRITVGQKLKVPAGKGAADTSTSTAPATNSAAGDHR